MYTYAAVDYHFRAANYISVAQLFLQDNVLLQRRMRLEDLKPTVIGHWGTCPGVNFLYAHLCRFIRVTKSRVQLVLGSGHAAPALLANLYLEGSLGEVYPDLRYGYSGLSTLIREFGQTSRLQTEVSAALPGTIMAGGELGAALPIAFGATLNNPELTVFCLLGDGELEAGATLSSLNCQEFISPANDGFLIIAVNFNEYKMGSRSIFSTWSDKGLRQFFESFNMEVFICEPSHEDCVKVFDSIAEIRENWRANRFTHIPVILFRNEKGWTGPNTISGHSYVGTHRSHKVAELKHPHDVENAVDIVEQWLQSYRPEQLFVTDGSPSELVLENIPDLSLRLGLKSHQLNSKHLERPRDPLERVTNLVKNHSKQLSSHVSPMTVIGELLKEYFDTPEGKHFLLFCPDEIFSNGLGNILESNSFRWKWRSTQASVPLSPQGRVVEILNEACCHGMLHGYNQTGRDGIYVTYEAFAPITASAISQYYKFLKQGKNYPWRESVPALKYIITSLGWRNCFTHQNPDLLNTLLSKTDPLVKVYFPSDANHALVCLREMLLERDSINAMVVGKTSFQIWRSFDQALEDLEKGYWFQDYGDGGALSSTIIIVAVGDYMVEESIQACRIVYRFCGDCHLRVVAPISSAVFHNSRSLSTMLDLANVSNPPLVVCTGYVKVFQGLLGQFFDIRHWKFFGYQDEGGEGSYASLLDSNGVGRYSLASEIAKVLNKVLPESHRGIRLLGSFLEQRRGLNLPSLEP